MSSDECHCEEGLPEWIMSYADMITILMAFFVVMYSMAGTPDEKKEQAVFQSLRDQFGPMVPGWSTMGRGPYVRTDSQLAKLSSTGGAKRQNKKSGGANQQGPQGEMSRVHSLRPGEQVSTGGVVFFGEGSAALSKEQEKQLQIVASEIGGKPQKIEIRGHTSRRPLPEGAPYRDNWDLAYSRCRHTMEYLTSLGIDPKRFRLSVAGDNEPAPGGGEALQRGLNSRVEVFLLNEVPETHSDQKTKKDPSATEGER